MCFDQSRQLTHLVGRRGSDCRGPNAHMMGVWLCVHGSLSVFRNVNGLARNNLATAKKHCEPLLEAGLRRFRIDECAFGQRSPPNCNATIERRPVVLLDLGLVESFVAESAQNTLAKNLLKGGVFGKITLQAAGFLSRSTAPTIRLQNCQCEFAVPALSPREDCPQKPTRAEFTIDPIGGYDVPSFLGLN